MKISLKEQGGWLPSAATLDNSIDLDLIDDDSARVGRALVEKLLKSPAHQRDSSHDRDAGEFRISIEHAGQTTVVSATSTSLSHEFAELLDWLKRHTAAPHRRNAKEE